jgi:alpha-L-fucosidase
MLKSGIMVFAVMMMSTAVFAQKYDTTWTSLKNYTVPEWYQDAKLGIYHHWGLYSVPGYGTEWYGRRMYDKNGDGPGVSFYSYHVSKYGSPSTFGNKDFVPMLKAENFNADDYIDIVIKAGAKYFAHMTSHHEAFLMYGTNITRWNCVNMGPKKDIGRMLMTAARKRGLKFGVSNHLAENCWFYQLNFHNNFDAVDTSLRDLYNDRNTSIDIYNTAPSDWWLKRWLALSEEMIDVFQPDYVYYDNGWAMHAKFEPYRRILGAYQYNKGIEWGRGTFRAPGEVLIYKSGGHNTNQFITGGAVHDIEGGAPDDIQTMTFQTDLPIGENSWGYLTNETYKTSAYLIDYLLDVVSKNGNLMLDIPPKPDGTLPDQVKTILSDLGGWLRINGEGVYATRVANVFGAGRLRFTRNKANTVIYVFDYDWPGNGAQLSVSNYGSSNLDKTKISKITLLGGGSVTWSQNASALTLTMPATKPTACTLAYGFKIYLDAQTTTLSAPTNLEAIGATNAIVLTWVDNSTKETGYTIERKSGSNGVYAKIATVGADVTTYSDTMSAATAYIYRVRAYNASGNSDYSNEAVAVGLDSSTVSVSAIPVENRKLSNSIRSITTMSGNKTIRFLSGCDAPVTFILYSLEGRILAHMTMNARRGMNSLTLDKLRAEAPSLCILEIR